MLNEVAASLIMSAVAQDTPKAGLQLVAFQKCLSCGFLVPNHSIGGSHADNRTRHDGHRVSQLALWRQEL